MPLQAKDFSVPGWQQSMLGINAVGLRFLVLAGEKQQQ
jgi:hypothetical protein